MPRAVVEFRSAGRFRPGRLPAGESRVRGAAGGAPTGRNTTMQGWPRWLPSNIVN